LPAPADRLPAAHDELFEHPATEVERAPVDGAAAPAARGEPCKISARSLIVMPPDLISWPTPRRGSRVSWIAADLSSPGWWRTAIAGADRRGRWSLARVCDGRSAIPDFLAADVAPGRRPA
jgi:hypothetical protein